MGACTQNPGKKACREVLSQLKNPLFISDQPGGTQVSGWVNAWVPAPSVYAVAARESSEVIAGVNFARKHNLRLAVKGGGHSYQGTSNAPDSQLIWLHAMNDIRVLDAFVPRGGEGRVAPMSVVTVGAGALWIDVYHAITTQAGRYVQGGGCTTVFGEHHSS